MKKRGQNQADFWKKKSINMPQYLRRDQDLKYGMVYRAKRKQIKEEKGMSKKFTNEGISRPFVKELGKEAAKGAAGAAGRLAMYGAVGAVGLHAYKKHKAKLKASLGRGIAKMEKAAHTEGYQPMKDDLLREFSKETKYGFRKGAKFGAIGGAGAGAIAGSTFGPVGTVLGAGAGAVKGAVLGSVLGAGTGAATHEIKGMYGRFKRSHHHHKEGYQPMKTFKSLREELDLSLINGLIESGELDEETLLEFSKETKAGAKFGAYAGGIPGALTGAAIGAGSQAGKGRLRMAGGALAGAATGAGLGGGLGAAHGAVMGAGIGYVSRHDKEKHYVKRGAQLGAAIGGGQGILQGAARGAMHGHTAVGALSGGIGGALGGATGGAISGWGVKHFVNKGKHHHKEEAQLDEFTLRGYGKAAGAYASKVGAKAKAAYGRMPPKAKTAGAVGIGLGVGAAAAHGAERFTDRKGGNRTGQKMNSEGYMTEDQLLEFQVNHGAFHRWLGKPESAHITPADIKKGLRAGGHAAKMANFARNFGHIE